MFPFLKKGKGRFGYLGIGFGVNNFLCLEDNNGKLLLIVFLLLSGRGMYLVDNPTKEKKKKKDSEGEKLEEEEV